MPPVDLPRVFLPDPQYLSNSVFGDEGVPLLLGGASGVYLVDICLVGGLQDHSLDVGVCTGGTHGVE